MNFSPGTKLGHYELLSQVGAGGMGEVYRAQDTRLNRVVAVKVLLGSAAGADAGLLRRFEQEARTLAALNHPNILAVHDLGSVDGTPYLVSEFLEGETLRAKLNAGPLPVRRAIEYALGIADGLAAGHSKGVVHRDIKPANIFLIRDGRIKILDFGLAKLVAPAGGLENAETLLTRDDRTVAGTVLGTVGYMSPEQVRGEPVSAATDIFSFGAVFYEMLSGKRAFKRDSAAETMTAILREEPPELAASGWSGPPALQRIVERCLEKDPERRFQSARDLSFAIESVSGLASGISSGALGAGAVGAKKRPSVAEIGWIAVALALCAMGWWVGRKTAVAPVVAFKQITFQRGAISAARFTRDGDTVLYSGVFDTDPMQIYSVRPSGLQPVKLALPSATLFAVSNGDQMLTGLEPLAQSTFWTGTLSEVSVTGGAAPRQLKDDVVSADYPPDGRIVAATRFVEGKCRLEYPLGKVLYESSGYLDYARVSPDGKTVAFEEHDILGDDRGWVVVAESSGKVRRLTKQYFSVQGLAWRPDGREIWFTASDEGTSSTIWGVGLSGTVRGILAVPAMAWLQDLATNGRLLLTTVRQTSRITAVDGATGKETPNLETNENSMLTDVSPDGKAVMYVEAEDPAEGQYHVIYRKTDGSPPLLVGNGTVPVLSPNGKTVAALLFGKPMKVALYPLGTGESRYLEMGPVVTATNIHWFPDGKRLAVFGSEDGKASRSYVVNVANGAAEPAGPEGFQVIAVSPDGKHLVGEVIREVASSASDPRALGEGAAATLELSTNELKAVVGMTPGQQVAQWSRDGEGLLVKNSDVTTVSIYRLDLATGKQTLVKQMETKGQGGGGGTSLWLAADEKSYVLFQIAQTGMLWTVDGVK
jgi:eukaryotic-like serine/threonine-protein kinase